MPLLALLDAAREVRHAALALRRRAGTGRVLATRSFSIVLLPALPPRTPPPPPPPPPPPAAAPEVPEREATPAPFGREGSDASLFADTLVEGLLERPGPLLPRTTPRRLSAGRRSWEVRAAALLSVYGVPCIVGHTSRQTAWQLASTAGMWGQRWVLW